MKKVLNVCFILLISLIFIDIVGADTYNNYSPEVPPASCGDNLLTDIPQMLPKVISIIYSVIQVAVPIVLIVMGSLDLMKGVTAQKEDEIKKGQQMFIKRLISGVLVFVVFIVVKLVISLVADGSSAPIMQCADCFISNDCD